MNAGEPVRRFPLTRWTLVLKAATHGTSKEAEQACGELVQLYRPALVAHLMYAWRLPHDQAEDLLHNFVANKVLMGNFLSHANRKLGKFRTFLLTSLDRYAISYFRKEHAARRSPGPAAILSLNDLADRAEKSSGTNSTSIAFDMAWIREIINETLRRVKHDCDNSGRAHYWALLEDRIVNPVLHGDKPSPYAQLVVRLGFVSPIQAACALVTTKRMFERTFRAIIRDYAGDDGEVDREIKELYAILSDISAYQ